MKNFTRLSYLVLSFTVLVSPVHAYLGGFEVDDGYMSYEDTLSSVSSSAPEANSHGLVPPCTFPTLNTGTTPTTGGHACDFTRYDAGGSGSANGGPGGSPTDITDNSGLWQALEGGRLYEDTAWPTRNDNNRNYITTYSIARSGQQSMDVLTANKDDAGANLRYKYSLDSRDFNGETPTSVTSGRVVMTFYFCPTGFKSAYGGAGHLGFDPSSRMSLMDSNGNVGFRFGFDSFTNSTACNVAYEAQGGSVMLGQTANPNNWDGARITLNLDTDKVKMEYFVVTTGQWTTLVNNVSMLMPMTNFSALEFWQAKGQFKNYWDDFSFEVLPPSCQITNTNVVAGACNDNSTPYNTADDFYTADVTVTFSNKPATGNLVLSGAALHATNSVTTIAVGSTTSSTTHTFTNVRLKANSTANALTSTFSADPACTMTINPAAVSACSIPNCNVTNLEVTPAACNNNGTNDDTADDYHTASVAVTFANKPPSGSLVLSGVALHSTNSVTTVAVGSTTSATTHTFVGVRLKANGVANAITATFSADIACTLTINSPAINSCAAGNCDCPGNLLNNPSFETGNFNGWTLSTNDLNHTSFAQDTTWAVCGNFYAYFNPTSGTAADYVSYYQNVAAAPGQTFTLAVYAGVHDSSKDHQILLQFFDAANNVLGGGQIVQVDKDVDTAPIGLAYYNLSGTAPAGTTTLRITAYAAGVYTNESVALKVDGFCLTVTSAPACNITNLVVTPGACNNNGTNNDEADDYYTTDVTVNFSNKPASGNLVLSGAALHASNSVTTVAVGSTTSAGSHTFTGVRVKANGVANAIIATFSADVACTLSVNAPSVNECSTPDCDITDLVVTPGVCNDNGTPADPTDDFYAASVAVTFTNKPASGNLVLSGAALHSSNSVTSVAVGATTSATTHTFAGVRLKADGIANSLTATFSADLACTMTINSNAIPSCSTPVGCCPQLIIDVP